MVDTYTPSLRIVEMPTGSNDGLWGDKADAAFLMFEQAIAGLTAVSLLAGNVTLTTANNASDQARNAAIVFIGAPGVQRTVTMPDVTKLTWCVNQTDSDIVFQTTGAGNAIILHSGQVGLVGTDGATNAELLIVSDAQNRVANQMLFSFEAL